jgi:hypothetical protein
MKDIRQADELMKEGNRQEAKELLDKLMLENPGNGAIFCDAVNILVYGKMYKEAIEVFSRYKTYEGKDLEADISIKEIEKVEREETLIFKDGELIFNRKSLVEKGFFTLFPIKQIRLAANYIIFMQRGREYKYNWADITKAELITKYRDTEYQGMIPWKTLVFSAGNRKFKVNVADSDANISNVDQLLSEVESHIKLIKIKSKKPKYYNLKVILIITIIYLIIRHFLR